MNFREVQMFVLDLLDKELPANLSYHGVHHTLDVCNAIEELSKGEEVSDSQLELLRIAALMHDIGFIEQYLYNEPIAVRYAHKILPGYGYSRMQIKTIGDIIMSTQIPQSPKNHVERIMCDADLDYLGRPDFFAVSENLKKEWFAYQVVSSEEEYNRKQISFFEQHKYFTRSAHEKRDPQKQLHLSKLKSSWNGYIVEVSNSDL
ncbi:MAG: HD domain-containing protein [Cyclobacteriaceae bacterium]